MQAHARALAGDRQRLVARLAAEERRPRLGTQQPRLHFAAGGAAGAGGSGILGVLGLDSRLDMAAPLMECRQSVYARAQ
ncbi:hypothetical protein G6F55_014584 [Rhizopus delemar]|nr:hypothetical protein G6F55_014584 [Rhizopus delemar]